MRQEEDFNSWIRGYVRGFISGAFCIWLIMTQLACGSGMIGLLPEYRVDKHDRIVMDDVYVIEESGHVFFVEIIGYFEPNINCEIDDGIENVFFTELKVWRDNTLMENGYIGPVQKSLHENYLELLCGI